MKKNYFCLPFGDVVFLLILQTTCLAFYMRLVFTKKMH